MPAVSSVTTQFLKQNGFSLCKFGFSVTVPTGTPLNFNFPDLPVINGKFQHILEVFTIDDVTNSPNNGTIIPMADFKRAYVNLTYNNIALFNLVPLYAMNVTLNNGRYFHLDNSLIDWQQCSMQFSAAGTLAAAQVIYFVAHYWNK